MSSGLFKNPLHNSLLLISVCCQFQWNRKLILGSIPISVLFTKTRFLTLSGLLRAWFLQTDVCNTVYTVNNRVIGVKPCHIIWCHITWSAQKGMSCFGGNIVTFQFFIITCEIDNAKKSFFWADGICWNCLNMFLFLVPLGFVFVILSCMIFLLPSLDAIRMSIPAANFRIQLNFGGLFL